jgi:hypothetical protein
LFSFFQSKSGQCVSCLSHCNYQTNVCLYINQLRRICSSIYLARNIRECQQRLTPDIVQAFLLSNRSNIFDNEKDNDEPVSYYLTNILSNLLVKPRVFYDELFFQAFF